MNVLVVKRFSLQVVLLCFSLLLHSETVSAEKPNILLIMADDVGSEVLGCYGGTTYKTPVLDQLAAGGMRFTHCYSMPVCHPTRIALMTGRYSLRWNNPAWGDYPKAAEGRSIGDVMKKAGYATAVAGKWQLTMMKNNLEHPAKTGFDEWCLFGWHEGSRYYNPMIYENGKVRDGISEKYGPDVYVDFLIDFMKKNQSRPFFAYYPMALCHDVTDDIQRPVAVGPRGRYDTYQEMVDAMDRCVGRLVSALDELQLRKKTIIIFTTDNGTPFSSYLYVLDGTPGQRPKLSRPPVISRRVYEDGTSELIPGGKGDMTEPGTRVPLIVNWPGKLKPGTVVDPLIDFSDFLPTCAELGGVTNLPDDLDGKSFAGIITGNSFQPREWAYVGLKKNHFVRNHRWKLFANGSLFDMQQRPLQQKAIPVSTTDPEATAARTQLQSVFKKEFPSLVP